MLSINNQPSILSAFNPIATPFKKLVDYTVRQIHLMSIKTKNNNKNSIFFILFHGTLEYTESLRSLWTTKQFTRMFVYTEGWKKMDIKPEIQYDISLYLVLFKCYLIPLSHGFFFNDNAFTKICEPAIKREIKCLYLKKILILFFLWGGGGIVFNPFLKIWPMCIVSCNF